MAHKGSILVTGAAGYIGSHAVLALMEAGWPVVALDDLSTGRRDLVPDGVTFIKGNVADEALVMETLKEHGCTGIMHFAGSIVVPESVADPLKYYHNNTEASRALIETVVKSKIAAFIFSSTASVYGAPDTVPIAESAPTCPENPYGSSKLMTEWILRDASMAHGLKYAALRYFNVAGADEKGRCGQVCDQSTHLIKIACEVAVGARDYMNLYGEDYDTQDGTCIRDFIHVSDLAKAHVLTLQRLLEGSENLLLNCGYGHGFSVRQVLAAVERAAGVSLDVRTAPRRPGDVAELVADVGCIRRVLGWSPRYDDLDSIVESALAWERKLKEKTP